MVFFVLNYFVELYGYSVCDIGFVMILYGFV